MLTKQIMKAVGQRSEIGGQLEFPSVQHSISNGLSNPEVKTFTSESDYFLIREFALPSTEFNTSIGGIQKKERRKKQKLEMKLIKIKHIFRKLRIFFHIWAVYTICLFLNLVLESQHNVVIRSKWITASCMVSDHFNWSYGIMFMCCLYYEYYEAKMFSIWYKISHPPLCCVSFWVCVNYEPWHIWILIHFINYANASPPPLPNPTHHSHWISSESSNSHCHAQAAAQRVVGPSKPIVRLWEWSGWCQKQE